MTTPNYCPENEVIKRRFRIWLQDAKGYAERSIDSLLAAIHEFEQFTAWRPFRRFHYEHARAFVREMKGRINPSTGRLYSKARLNGTFGALRKFFAWLGGEPEFRKSISIADAEYFRLNEKDTRIARATRPKRVPDIEEVQQVLAAMPAGTELEKRDRAVVAFIVLTGARVTATISAKIKHVDLAEGLFFQDAREVKTKRAKTFTTWFFPVAGMVREVVEDWIRHLQAEHGFGPDDPLFPATRRAHDNNRQFVAAGLSRQHWQADQPVRDIFRAAWNANGLPPPNPHLIRDTLVHYGLKVCTIEEFKAWSQNLGHEQVHTTLGSYGTLDERRQRELMRGIGTARQRPTPADDEIDDAMIRRVLAHVEARVLKPELSQTSGSANNPTSMSVGQPRIE